MAVKQELIKVSFLTAAAVLLPSDEESDLSELRVPVIVMALLQAGMFASALLTERVSGRNCEKKVADDSDSDEDDAAVAGQPRRNHVHKAFHSVWECVSSTRPQVLSAFCIVTAVTLYVANLVAQQTVKQSEIPAAGMGLAIRAAIAYIGVRGLETWLSWSKDSDMCACGEQCDAAFSTYDLCPYSEEYWADAMPEKHMFEN